jgi:hypothetical protein
VVPSRQGSDFHRDTAELAEQIIPQHNYRLDAASMEGRHYGEVRMGRGAVCIESGYVRLSLPEALPVRLGLGFRV